jgi:hypothetical protein
MRNSSPREAIVASAQGQAFEGVVVTGQSRICRYQNLIIKYGEILLIARPALPTFLYGLDVHFFRSLYRRLLTDNPVRPFWLRVVSHL